MTSSSNLKWEDMLEEVHARGGRLYHRERAKDVGWFCWGLVEETGAGGGGAEGPEL